MSASPGTSAATDVLLVAGEASGDLHGATLARALWRLEPGLTVAGMGGPRMAEAGVQILQRIEPLAVVGGTEALARLPALWRALRTLRGALSTRRPRALVLIDFPEFNFRLARLARRVGVPVVYFVPPQVWAWRRGRLRTMARDVSRVLAIFPFEVGMYQEAGIPVDFVGHPILDALPTIAREDARQGLAGDGEALVGLLPGSRPDEVRRHLPVLLDAAARLAARQRPVRFALPLAPTLTPADVAAATAAPGLSMAVLAGAAHRVMAASDLVLVASGTATLEAACYGTPMVVLYRLSRVSYVLARALVRGVSHIALPNIIAGRGVVPELIQDRATAGAVAAAARRLLDDPDARAAQRAALAEVRARLGEPGAAVRAARAVLRERDGTQAR